MCDIITVVDYKEDFIVRLKKGKMEDISLNGSFFGTEKIGKILLRLAPPVMLAQLIQALYNIVDSFFVGKYSDAALTALTVIYPLQLVIIALAVGTGVGVNTYMARKFAQSRQEDAYNAAGTGTVLAIAMWAVFAIVSVLLMKPYVMTSASAEDVIADAVIYGNIVCVGSIGSFLEGTWTKVHQSKGNMKLPMLAQVVGAVVNIVLDPILIFGWGPIPELGVAGAAYATVLGQIAAAVITGIKGFHKPPKLCKMPYYIKKIYFYGYSSILMQLLFTVYIVVLNVILASFSDSAVTVLGLYYKLQSFFFIPLFGLQTCIVPVLSFNYAIAEYKRCRRIMRASFLISACCMLIGVIAFVFFPNEVISIFSSNADVHKIGETAFPIIGSSFICAAFSLMMPVFFQAIGDGKTSLALSLTRQIFCLIPIFWLFSLIGLNYTWIAFPASETIAGTIGIIFYFNTVKKWTSVI